jgi:hypothetical protein
LEALDSESKGEEESALTRAKNLLSGAAEDLDQEWSEDAVCQVEEWEDVLEIAKDCMNDYLVWRRSERLDLNRDSQLTLAINESWKRIVEARKGIAPKLLAEYQNGIGTSTVGLGLRLDDGSAVETLRRGFTHYRQSQGTGFQRLRVKR